MELGDRIRELRRDKHMTQEELALRLGLQKSAIAKYEKGRVTNIKRDTLLRMAQILEASPGYLLYGGEGGIQSAGCDDDIPGLESLTGYYRRLNHIGRTKALDNLHDLTQIPAYCSAAKPFLLPMAAHNDDAGSPEQQRLMQEDMDDL